MTTQKIGHRTLCLPTGELVETDLLAELPDGTDGTKPETWPAGWTVREQETKRAQLDAVTKARLWPDRFKAADLAPAAPVKGAS